MKTNVTLMSRSRNLFGITIRQETKTSFLSLTDLQTAYAELRKTNGLSDRRVTDILGSSANAERVYFILKKRDSIKTDFPAFMESVESKGLTTVLKENNYYITKGRGENKSTLCDPYIWALIAMEMNPMLYAEVITWLTDKLILNRIDAGDMYRDLSAAVSRFNNVDYSRLAQALNHIVFGKHETGIRNKGTESELSELHLLESNLAFSINSEFLTSFEEVMSHLRKVWSKKYNPVR